MHDAVTPTVGASTSEMDVHSSTGELRIDQFDQWSNPKRLRLWPSNLVAPAETSEVCA